MAFPDSRFMTLPVDDTFGFHGMEFEMAVRHNLPFIGQVGDDTMWSAEHQVQLRKCGPERAPGYVWRLSRYDEVAEVSGGQGENVIMPAERAPARERSRASGIPAGVNVAVQRTPGPVVPRAAAQQARDGGGP